MGLNAYLAAVGSKGRSVGSTLTTSTVTVDIDGKAGKRLVIRAFAVTASESTTHLYFMTTIRKAAASAAIVSNATTITTTAFSTAPTTSGVIVIVLDDGTYQWTTVSSTATTTSTIIASALTDTVAAGNPIYYLGLYTDTNHFKFYPTVSVQTCKELNDGIFYGSMMGGPMRAHYHSAGSATVSIDYVTFGYINV